MKRSIDVYFMNQLAGVLIPLESGGYRFNYQTDYPYDLGIGNPEEGSFTTNTQFAVFNNLIVDPNSSQHTNLTKKFKCQPSDLFYHLVMNGMNEVLDDNFKFKITSEEGN